MSPSFYDEINLSEFTYFVKTCSKISGSDLKAHYNQADTHELKYWVGFGLEYKADMKVYFGTEKLTNTNNDSGLKALNAAEYTDNNNKGYATFYPGALLVKKTDTGDDWIFDTSDSALKKYVVVQYKKTGDNQNDYDNPIYYEIDFSGVKVAKHSIATIENKSITIATTDSTSGSGTGSGTDTGSGSGSTGGNTGQANTGSTDDEDANKLTATISNMNPYLTYSYQWYSTDSTKATTIADDKKVSSGSGNIEANSITDNKATIYLRDCFHNL